MKLDTSQRLKPARSSSLLLAMVALPFAGLSGAGLWLLTTDSVLRAWSEDWLWIVSGTITAAGLAIWLMVEVSTIEVVVSSDAIEFRQYGISRWRADAAHLALEDGVLNGFIPILKLSDTRTGKPIGRILTSQFNSADIDRLRGALRRS